MSAFTQRRQEYLNHQRQKNNSSLEERRAAFEKSQQAAVDQALQMLKTVQAHLNELIAKDPEFGAWLREKIEAKGQQGFRRVVVVLGGYEPWFLTMDGELGLQLMRWGRAADTNEDHPEPQVELEASEIERPDRFASSAQNSASLLGSGTRLEEWLLKAWGA